jgi:hypothetical protein
MPLDKKVVFWGKKGMLQSEVAHYKKSQAVGQKFGARLFPKSQRHFSKSRAPFFQKRHGSKKNGFFLPVFCC